jgi:hypothetical protein
MTQTQTPAVFIGKCVACKKTYRGIGPLWCDCRNVDCDSPYCAPFDYEIREIVLPHRHPKTAVKAKALKVLPSEHDCDGRCTSAKSDKCACVCGGANHGSAYGI